MSLYGVMGERGVGEGEEEEEEEELERTRGGCSQQQR